MRLSIRSTINIIECTSRFLCTAAAENTKPVINKWRKAYHVKTMATLDLFINKKLQNNETLKDTHWPIVREELITLNEEKKTCVDSQIFDLCFHYKQLDQAINYFKFLENNNYELNLYNLTTYLRIYHIRNTQISPKEEKDIYRIYDLIRQKYPLLDGQSCGYCIVALALTKRWKETFELLEMMKLSSVPGVTIIGAVICAALRNNEPEIAWSYINKLIVDSPLLPIVYLEYLNYCKRSFKGEDLINEIEKMLIFWQEHQVEPKEYVIKEYANVFNTLNYVTTYTSVSNRGCCFNCKKYLNQLVLTSTDFQLLSKEIMKKVIVGENVFCATSPQELKRYMLFIKTMRPYNVIIDGLNVAYAQRKRKEGGSLDAVLQVVEHFLQNKQKRILVIGRAHMNWWSKNTMKIIKEKADVFLIKNISEDDPFLLHVTLLSGPETYFVSNDLMRQHKNKLDDVHLQKLFKQWQLSRQCRYNKTPSGKIQIIPPLPFETTAQKNKNGWHIPYTQHDHLHNPEMYIQSQHWACIMRTTTKKQLT